MEEETAARKNIKDLFDQTNYDFLFFFGGSALQKDSLEGLN